MRKWLITLSLASCIFGSFAIRRHLLDVNLSGPIFNQQKWINHKKKKPSEELTFTILPKVADNLNENTFYADIINHTKTPVLEYTKSTNAHETTHFINSDLRNTYGEGKNAFYLGNNRAVIIEEPKIKKRQVIPFIPKILRFNRFKLYLEEQEQWDDQPLYLMDEWTAYINGGKVAVECVKNGEKIEWNDAVTGGLEFSIYCTALAMAIKEHDPEYWKNNKQFKNFLIWQLKNAQSLYNSHNGFFDWDKQDKLLKDFLTSEEAKPMRNFIKENLESAWINQVVK